MKTILLFVLLVISFGSVKADSEDLIARVLFSEGSTASLNEVKLIYSVIKNRVNNKNFKSPSSMSAVVLKKGAFTSVNSKKNKNWGSSVKEMSQNTMWYVCKRLGSGDLPAYHPTIVLYHERRIPKPAWANVKLEVVTENFKFYSLQG